MQDAHLLAKYTLFPFPSALRALEAGITTTYLICV